jgi:hypothetical protein
LNGIQKLIHFHPIWGNDASKLVEKEKVFNSGISKYLELWKLNILIDETFAKAM